MSSSPHPFTVHSRYVLIYRSGNPSITVRATYWSDFGNTKPNNYVSSVPKSDLLPFVFGTFGNNEDNETPEIVCTWFDNENDDLFSADKRCFDENLMKAASRMVIA